MLYRAAIPFTSRLFASLFVFTLFFTAQPYAQETDDLEARVEVLRQLLREAESALGAAQPAVASSEDTAFFNEKVLPIFSEVCFECHGEKRQRGDFRMDTYQAMLLGGKTGLPVFVAGNPDASRMIQAVRREGELKMPPDEELWPEDVAILEEWVKRGAIWPGSAEVEPLADAHSEAAPSKAAVPMATLTVASGPEVDFDREVLPILADKCFACHGPDAAVRKADLRLDDPAAAFAELPSGRRALVAGELDVSQVFQRIAAEDPLDRMPPPDFTKELTDDEIQTLGRWIQQGAPWEKHWAFVPPKQAELPEVSQPEWVRNPIDAFVLARLDREGLSPAAEADKRTLIRRVTFDLTGLPPTLDEIDAFLADDEPGAYERVVDRLLMSPRYGEHSARYWLDAARYADTNGYHIDNERYMWRWRDWVIGAFNKNMPYDQFTIEQLAGDLMPSPGQSELIATGFNRNHMINFEGGAIPEEYRVQYVIDRVDTTSTVWMGLTAGCAQCHDHKYDPISQKEFYEFAAFFNSVKERGLDGNSGNAQPSVVAPLDEQQTAVDEQRMLVAETEAALLRELPEVDAAQAAWEAEWRDRFAGRWTTLTPESMRSQRGADLTVLDDGSILVSGFSADQDIYEIRFEADLKDIQAIRIEAIPDDSNPKGGTGRSDSGVFVLTGLDATAEIEDEKSRKRNVRFDEAFADRFSDEEGPALTIDRDTGSGWRAVAPDSTQSAVFVADQPFGYGEGGTLFLRLRHESKTAKAALGRFRVSVTTDPAIAPSKLNVWHATGRYRFASGDTALDETFPAESGFDSDATAENGQYLWSRVTTDPAGDGTLTVGDGAGVIYLQRTIESPVERTMRVGLGSKGPIVIWLNGAEVYRFNEKRSLKADTDFVDLNLQSGKNDLLVKLVNHVGEAGIAFRAVEERREGLLPSEQLLIASSADSLTDGERTKLRRLYRSQHWSEWPELEAKLAAQREELKKREDAIPTVMVMGEMETPRQTFVLKRGQYDQPTTPVTADTPDFLPPMEEELPENRLGLAWWLMDRNHPLTARVAVNRFWQQHFGLGIVRTSEDFGTQGARPVHPELLDYLAVTFIESCWDVKAMHRLMVTSSTYRQSARGSAEALDRDPENRLYARGPRFRLDAEQIRDAALAVSGLLVEKIGGPSVKPYQPKGLWEEVAYGANFTAQVFEPDSGDALYRRSMYTFWKRTAPPPSMMLFDAPNRETCTVRRARSNTPLQALALMNDPQFVEAARAFAERTVREGGDTPESRIAFAFEAATGRPPVPRETEIILSNFETQRARFAENAEAAAGLIAVGDSEPPADIEADELAAWTVVTSLILNLDETITRG